MRIGGDTKSVRSDTLPGGEVKARVEKTEAKDGLHRAACLLTISDSFVNHRELSAKERETSFDDMMSIALETGRVCGSGAV